MLHGLFHLKQDKMIMPLPFTMVEIRQPGKVVYLAALLVAWLQTVVKGLEVFCYKRFGTILQKAV